jgi:hypothetical protein
MKDIVVAQVRSALDKQLNSCAGIIANPNQWHAIYYFYLYIILLHDIIFVRW